MIDVDDLGGKDRKDYIYDQIVFEEGMYDSGSSKSEDSGVEISDLGFKGNKQSLDSSKKAKLDNKDVLKAKKATFKVTDGGKLAKSH